MQQKNKIENYILTKKEIPISYKKGQSESDKQWTLKMNIIMLDSLLIIHTEMNNINGKFKLLFIIKYLN